MCKFFNQNYLNPGETMSPEPIDGKPVRKVEIRGGDKLSDYVPNMDEEGTYPYLETIVDGFLDDDEWDDDL
jgi:hypothetical protein